MPRSNVIAKILTAAVSAASLTACHLFDRFKFERGPFISDKSGVVFYDSSRAMPGLNIVNDESMKSCRVIDMVGVEQANLPGGFCIFLPNGDYFASVHGPTLFDREFSQIWSRPDIEQRHEAVYDRGRDWFWVLAYEQKRVKDKNYRYDRLIGLDRKTGQTRFSWNPEEHLKIFEGHISSLPKYHVLNLSGDLGVTHLNSISVIPEGAAGAGKPGQLLLSDTGGSGMIYILDPDTSLITWFWHNGTKNIVSLDHHSAHYLPSGEILFYVNNVWEEVAVKYGFPFSFIARIDSSTGNVLWTYQAPPGREFYSKLFGNAEPLDNGNILVTHITKGGSAFEVTPSGRVVWEWNNDRLDPAGRRANVYRVSRVPAATISPYIQKWRLTMGAR